MAPPKKRLGKIGIFHPESPAPSQSPPPPPVNVTIKNGCWPPAAGSPSPEPSKASKRPPAAIPLTIAGCELSRTGLAIQGTLPYETWQEIGLQVCAVASSAGWWVGDWLIYGTNRWGYDETYLWTEQATGLSPQTLTNYASVCRRFPPSQRRGKLSFSHHAEVAPLPAVQRTTVLTTAVVQDWSVNRTRSEVRALHVASQPDPVNLVQEERLLRAIIKPLAKNPQQLAKRLETLAEWLAEQHEPLTHLLKRVVNWPWAHRQQLPLLLATAARELTAKGT
jgi:hypothetical protein